MPSRAGQSFHMARSIGRSELHRSLVPFAGLRHVRRETIDSPWQEDRIEGHTLGRKTLKRFANSSEKIVRNPKFAAARAIRRLSTTASISFPLISLALVQNSFAVIRPIVLDKREQADSPRHRNMSGPPAILQYALGERSTSMARKKKHSSTEIASKLTQADQMAAQGKHQVEIARALDVSVMTLHRWRKLSPEENTAPVATDRPGQFAQSQVQGDRIAELQLENSRLRQLLTDLLLERMKLEEVSGLRPSARRSSQ